MIRVGLEEGPTKDGGADGAKAWRVGTNPFHLLRANLPDAAPFPHPTAAIPLAPAPTRAYRVTRSWFGRIGSVGTLPSEPHGPRAEIPRTALPNRSDH